MDYCRDSNCKWRLNAAKQALQMKPQYIYTYVYSIIVIFLYVKTAYSNNISQDMFLWELTFKICLLPWRVMRVP